MALVPLVWLTLRRERRGFWWWLAAAFAVSWIPDTLADMGVSPWWMSAVYPISQAGLFVIILAPIPAATFWMGLLMMTGIGAILWEGASGPTLMLRAIAAAAVLSSAWPHQEIRSVALIAYGLGFLAWVAFAFWPSTAPGWWDIRTWGSPLYWLVQSVRAVSLGLFCRVNYISSLRLA